MMVPVRLRPLLESDERAVRPWLESYLRQHLGWWSEAIHGAAWDDDAIGDHLLRHDLVAVEWRNLHRASEASDSYVQVAHDETRPLGVVWGEVRTDRFLCSPMGVVSWIYVSEDRRGGGIGKLLLEATNGWFLWRDVAGRTLHVTAQNKAAMRLYGGMGYEVADHRLLGPTQAPSTEGEE